MLSKEEFLPAIQHPQLAEMRLISELGEGDQERGITIATVIGGKYKDVYADIMARAKRATGSSMVDLDRMIKRPQIALNRLSESWDRLVTGVGRHRH